MKIIASHPEGPAQGLVFYGNKAIVGAGAALLFFDLSGNEPVKMGRQRLPFGIQDMATDGSRLYVLGAKEVRIFDLTALAKRGQQPMVLPLLGTLPFQALVFRLAAFPGYLFLIGTAGVHIYDASRPEAIVKLSLAVALFAIEMSLSNDLSRLYVASWQGMKAFDISDPKTPVLLGSYTASSSVNSFATVRDRAFLGLEGRVEVLDISDPANIQSVGSIPSYPMDIIGYDCNDDAGLFILSDIYVEQYSLADLSSPVSRYRPNKKLDRFLWGGNWCNPPLFFGGYGERGVEFGAYDGALMNPLGGYDTFYPIINTINDPDFPYRAYGVSPRRIYEADWGTDPEQPGIRATDFNGVGDQYGFSGPVEIWQQNGKRIGAFDIGYAQGTSIRDFTDFDNPYELARIKAGGFTQVVEECGNYLILGTQEGEIIIFDASDPKNPVEVSRTMIPNGNIRHIETACPDRLYIAADDAGMVILDMTDKRIQKYSARSRAQHGT
ncbi:MAG: hypothetical protein Q9P14_14100 [candidate division KSB1 bacterium]|nr:hypothetical protein [candidate division KSB1 bacterium]